jgi:hypothetical protein
MDENKIPFRKGEKAAKLSTIILLHWHLKGIVAIVWQ